VPSKRTVTPINDSPVFVSVMVPASEPVLSGWAIILVEKNMERIKNAFFMISQIILLIQNQQGCPLFESHKKELVYKKTIR
jgi:hypothetical protein